MLELHTLEYNNTGIKFIVIPVIFLYNKCMEIN